jgi:hypothetical protein
LAFLNWGLVKRTKHKLGGTRRHEWLEGVIMKWDNPFLLPEAWGQCILAIGKIQQVLASISKHKLHYTGPHPISKEVF